MFDEVTFEYTDDAPVFERLSLHITPGERVALVGASGIGKSTLISLLLRLYDPTAGAVRIDGRDIREFTIASLRSHISVVLQETILFAASVWDNIGAAVPDATREDILEAARLANADEFINRLPEQYDTILGERGVTLSGGERQRIAIARAAMRNAPILVLDEPTTGLDETNARLVTDALERLSRGRTTILVTHDLATASRSDRIVYLENRGIVEQGTHAELLRAGGRYATVWGLQQNRSEDLEEADAER